jgi:cell wall-associated NlpC family hydrolase
MANQRPGLTVRRPMQRAMQALTKRFMPGKAGQAVEMALGAKALIAAAPVLLVVLVLITAVIAVIGAASGASASEGAGGGCIGGLGGGAAPVELKGPPKNLIPIYQAASTAAGLNPEGPAVLAGINRVETDFGQDMNTSSAGAIGWMQFEPSTWAEYGDGGNAYDAHDAIFAAARLLKANGAPGNWYKAIFGYNHADWYVEEVEKYAHEYAAEVPADPSVGGKESPESAEVTSPQEVVPVSACGPETGELSTVAGEKVKLLPNGLAAAPAGAPQQVKQMIAAGNQIAMLPYVWGGHHALGSATNGYDCSSATSYLLNAAGLLPPGSAGFQGTDFYTDYVAENFRASGPIPGLQEGPGKWVTIYVEDTGAHVYMTIAGVRFDDSSSSIRNGKGPNGTNISTWQPAEVFPRFTASHPANL